MKKIAFVFLSCLMTFTAYSKDLTGKWTFNAPNAPYGYQEGTVEFKKIDGKPCAEVNFETETVKVDIQETEENLYNTSIPVMGSEITVKLDNSKGDMKTTVDAMGTVIDVKLSELNK